MDVPMSVITCASCHIPFAIPSDMETRLRECHNWFYCPNGHVQYFPAKSTIEIVREKLWNEQKKVKQYEAEKAAEFRKRRAAAKKAVETKKAKKAGK